MKNKIIKSLLILVTLIVIVFSYKINLTHGFYVETYEYENITNKTEIEYIDINQPQVNSFIIKDNYFAGLSLIFSDINSTNDGKIQIVITEKNNNKIIEKRIIEENEINNLKWYHIKLKNKLKKDTIYNLIIKGENTNAKLLKVNKELMNRELQNDSYWACFAYSKPIFNLYEKTIINIFLIILIMIIHDLIFKCKKKKKYIFCGMILLLFINFTTNYFNPNNNTFNEFQADSESLVLGSFNARKNKENIPQYGLGTYNQIGSNINYNHFNDINWSEGYNLYEPKIMIANNDFTKTNAIVGNYIKFSNNEFYKIVDVETFQFYIILKLDNEVPLNIYRHGNIKKALICENENQCNKGSYLTYKSQYGLQGKVFRFIGKIFSYNDSVIEIYKILCSLSLAVVFCLIIFYIQKKYNNQLLSVIFFLTFLLSPWIVNFARNLYWIEFLWFIPYLIGLIVSCNIDSKKIKRNCYIATIIALFLKCLCGYEYLSTIMLGLIQFLIIDLIIEMLKKQKNKTKIKQIIKVIIMIGIYALIGFVLALLVHSLLRGEGNLIEGLKSIVKKDVLKRTNGGNINNFSAVFWDSINASIFDVLKIYYNFSTEIISGVDGALFPIISTLALILAIVDRKKDNNKNLIIYCVFNLTSISWYILGKQHSFIHYHMNYVLWYFGYVQICFYIIINYIINTVRKVRK